MTIYPSILSDSVLELQRQLDLSSASQAEVAQIDIVDGFFADNITVAPLDLAVAEFGDIKIDLHLMVDEPMDFVFEAEGVNNSLPIRAIIAQIEHMSYQSSFIEEVQKQNWRAGLSLDIGTPLEEIEDEAWQRLDIIQLMAIEAGFQGQAFLPQVLEKLEELQIIRKQLGRTIEVIVDGGVEFELLEKLGNLGVDGVTVGSAFWTVSEPITEINRFITQA